MKSNTFFSIIIPVYNTEKFLPRCIKSVLNQTYKSFEIIVVNDNSPGNCTEIVTDYNDIRIRYINKAKNEGTHLARKTGVEKASSEYCLFLDSDDYYESNALEVLHTYLEKYPVDLLEFGYKKIPNYTKNKFLYLVEKENYLNRVLAGNLTFTNFNLINKPIKTSIAKTAFMKMKNFHCIWFEDGYEQFIISAHCKTFDAIEKYIAIQDDTSGITNADNSIPFDKFSMQINSVLMVVNAIEDYIQEENLDYYMPMLQHILTIHLNHLLHTYYPKLDDNVKVEGLKFILNTIPENLATDYIKKLLKKKDISSLQAIKILAKKFLPKRLYIKN